MKQGPGFKVTDGKGFHITFANGYTVSVQFGYGNYCDNYDLDKELPWEERHKRENPGSTNAECAIWGPDGKMIDYGDWGNTVSNRSTPAGVLELFNWAASQSAKPGVE